MARDDKNKSGLTIVGKAPTLDPNQRSFLEGLAPLTKVAVDKTRSEPPPHTGHRQRLRDRFRKTGPEGLPDYELLELVLFRAIPAATPSLSPNVS